MNEMAAESQAQTPVAGKQFRRGLHGALRLALDLALPPLCPSCREPLGDGIGLRAGCWSKLSFIEPPYCARLGIPFLYDPGPGLLLMEAIDNPPAYDRARAAVRYDDVARAPVMSYKYSDRMDLAPLTGRWMARAGAELLADADALVPVPLHWRRLWARRFNQSATLAGGISAASGVPVMHVGLEARRATAQQVGLSKADRAENVQGAFRVPAEEKNQRRRPPSGADRRRAHLRRHRRYLRARTFARRRRPCGCAGFRPGCGAGPHSHINGAIARHRRNPHAARSKSTPPVFAPIAIRPRRC